MPRRSPPPDRRAVEAALSDAERSVLWDQASVLGIPMDKWHLVPRFAAHWGTIATVRLAEKFRAQSPGHSYQRAIPMAAGKHGLIGESVRTRWMRFFWTPYWVVGGCREQEG